MQKAHVIRILHGRYELFPGRMRFYAWPRKGSKMKTISFAVPCYNSAAYMDKCIESLLACDEGKNDIEILIVDDGSTKDNTAEIADAWQEKYPDTIRAIHKPNGGHGSAVNTGLTNAEGRYFKVVDSDDWLDKDAMHEVMAYLRRQMELAEPTDMVIGNYVYEKVHEGTRTVMGYKNVFPVDEEFGWDDTKHFHQSQYLLMHSVIYRTELLQDLGLKLPEHTFYVDNIFVFKPLPSVRTMYYLDVDMYRYFIGREDQSVNEKIMYARRDQQLRVTRIMIDAMNDAEIESKKLERYMLNYLSMMMCICSIFLRMEKTDENEENRAAIWEYLKEKNPELYKRVKNTALNWGTNIPTEAGRQFGLAAYHIAQKIFKFN